MGVRSSLGIIVLMLGSAATAAGQDVLLETNAARAGAVYPPDGLLPDKPPPDADPTARFRWDAVLGLPFMLRANYRLSRHQNMWLEGGASLYLFVPGVFAGVRYDGRFHQGERNCWYTRPGIDVFYSPIRDGGSWFFPAFNGMAAITIDNELVWQRRWSNRLEGYLGLKAGFGAAFFGGHVVPLPVLGLVCGWQY